KKLMLLILILPFASWAQNDSLKLEKKKPIILTSISSNGLPNPLMVVDGTLVDYDKTINEINPDEIESITVLKNENAVKKYGEKGKNGVIEIHLKEKKEEFSYLELLSAPIVCYAGIIEESAKSEYDLAVLDLGYESFLAMQPSAKTYSLSYLQNKNKQYVSIWNSRVNTGNPYIYEMRIDYDSQTYYGLEFEYKLFQFFKFMEDKYLISFNS